MNFIMKIETLTVQVDISQPLTHIFFRIKSIPGDNPVFGHCHDSLNSVKTI